MKVQTLFLSLLIFVSIASPCRADDYTLFNRSRSSYSIVVSKEASPSEKFAAQELQKFLYEISGARLQIVDVNQGRKGKRIIVGFNKDAESCLDGLEKPLSNDQSFRYFSNFGDIVILGGTEIGTLYGVYHFLENEFDCRWLTDSVSDIPKKRIWTFSSLDYHSSPAFDYRYLYSKNAFDKLWAMRNQYNGRPDSYKTQFGEIGFPQVPFWGVHTFNRFVPPSKYFSKHPEYYSLIKGKRDSKQLCLTNETVKQLCIDALRDVIKSSPSYKVFDLSQNDNTNSCQCRKCERVKKKYGSESGLIIWFVNSVAEELKKEFPDVYIGTLAYQFSQKAPISIAPDDNVVVRLGVINTCLIHGFDDCQKNLGAAKDVRDWGNLTNNLYVWDYISTSRIYYTPIPNFEAIKKRLEYYKECGVRGVLLEGNSSIDNGEFSGMRSYVISKLLWNPQADLQELVDDFIKRYYGKAGSYIKQYYDLTQQRASLKENHLFFVMDHKNKIYSEDYLKNAYSLLSQAAKVADNNIIKQRVDSEKMSVAYMLCKVSPRESTRLGALDFVKKWSDSNDIKSFAGYGENVDKQKFFEQMKAYE